MAAYPTQDTYNYDDFVLGETEGTELVTIATGQTLEAGQVLAKSTADGEYYAYDPVGTDGLNEISRILKDDVDTSTGAAEALVWKGGKYDKDAIVGIDFETDFAAELTAEKFNIYFEEVTE